MQVETHAEPPDQVAGFLLTCTAVNKSLSFALIAAVGAGFAACASHAHHSANKPLEHVRPSLRRDAIRRAQVWEATDVPSMDLTAGPKGHGAFTPDQTVEL